MCRWLWTVFIWGWMKFLWNRLWEIRKLDRLWTNIDHWYSGKCCYDELATEYHRLAEEHSWQSVDSIDGGISSLLAAKLQAAVALVIHEDALNWTKFHHFVATEVALFTAFGFLASDQWILFSDADAELLWMRIVTALGVAGSLGFTVTLWSGLSCLAGHKQAVIAIDRALAGLEHTVRSGLGMINPGGPGSILMGKQGPTRVVLRAAPVGMLVIWGLVYYLTPSRELDSTGPAGRSTVTASYRVLGGELTLSASSGGAAPQSQTSPDAGTTNTPAN